MKNKPEIHKFMDGSTIWENEFDKFRAIVYIPTTDLPEDIINFGYEAPYLLYFANPGLSLDEAKKTADENGLTKIASAKATSVVFVIPKADSWANAPEGLFEELISNSKIHQYHEDGMAVLINRFNHSTDGFAIRGAIFRTYLYGKCDAADYIATKLLKTVNGDGLWGPADVAPTAVMLDSLSVKPVIERRDMPIISIANNDEINEFIKASADDVMIADKVDFEGFYDNFLRNFIRWGWVGTLQQSPDFEAIGMDEEFCVTEVKTSSDNCGDDAGTQTHKIGYIAYYNKDLFEKGPAPVLLCFHGGGDSAMHISQVSAWYKVAHDHNFLLICIENHLNSTATEMMELLEQLKGKYNIDATKVYGSGFSMGGCKSWDLYQEYPDVFAGLAPMDATFEVGLNVFGKPAPCEINKDTMVPIFYVGGEETPLPELPFQADKCLDRMKYVFGVNKIVKAHPYEFDAQDKWENKIWGVDGDEIEKIYDPERDSTLTLHMFKSEDGNVYTAFGAVSGQGHECRYHSCDNAWKFLVKFSRVDGKIVIK